MTSQYTLAFLLWVVLMVIGYRLYCWIRDDGLYHHMYPGAKLLDDLATANKLHPGDAEKLITQIGSAQDPHAAVDTLRAEILGK